MLAKTAKNTKNCPFARDFKVLLYYSTNKLFVKFCHGDGRSAWFAY